MSVAATYMLLSSVAPAAAQSIDKDPAFSAPDVDRIASERAKAPFQPPPANLRKPGPTLGTTSTGNCVFVTSVRFWRGEQRNFEVHLLPSAGSSRTQSTSTLLKMARREYYSLTPVSSNSGSWRAYLRPRNSGRCPVAEAARNSCCLAAQ